MISDLIYDVGVHNGDDTAYYLHKGYRVVSVEANPLRVKEAQSRFKAEIDQGRLVLLNVGVSPHEGIADFWVSDQKDDWSSFDKSVAGRNNLPCHPEPVQCMPFRKILEKYGTPYYLKIDIEGNDIHCLNDLDARDLPRYVTIEAHSLEYLLILSRLGYNGFKCTSQVHHNNPLRQIIPLSGEIPGHLINQSPLLGQATARKQQEEREAATQPPDGVIDRLLGRLNLQRIPRPVEMQRQHVPSAETYRFPTGASGPLGGDTPGEWLTMEQIAYKWLPLRLRLLDKLDADIPVTSWFDFHAAILTSSDARTE
jgi:FkbM family methyltransferase